MDKIKKSPEEWKKELDPELYKIAFEKGTEAPFSGKLLKMHDDGTYRCAVCGNPLFDSKFKFDSGTGWPSFDRPISEGAIEYEADNSYGMIRMEVKCGRCGAHLGHVFEDGPKEMPDGMPGTGKRFCLNSVCLDLEKQGKK